MCPTSSKGLVRLHRTSSFERPDTSLFMAAVVPTQIL